MTTNFRIKVIDAEKRSEEDNYDQGCIGNEKSTRPDHAATYNSIEEAFQDIVGDKSIEAKEIRTIDPNIYREVKGGAPRVAVDNQHNGLYRCTYDREENSHGRKPSAAEQEKFKAGKINLRLADYELRFQIISVGLDEDSLADFLGASRL